MRNTMSGTRAGTDLTTNTTRLRNGGMRGGGGETPSTTHPNQGVDAQHGHKQTPLPAAGTLLKHIHASSAIPIAIQCIAADASTLRPTTVSEPDSTGYADATSRSACHEICAGRLLEGAVDLAGVHAPVQPQAAQSPHACAPCHPPAAPSRVLDLHQRGDVTGGTRINRGQTLRDQ